MADAEINGVSYSIGKLNVMEQMHVVRRLLPVISRLGNLTQTPALGTDLSTMLGPIADAVAGLEDKDLEYVVSRCMSVVRRVQPGGGMAPIWNRQANTSQFEDIGMDVVIQLIGVVLRENIGPFWNALSLDSGPAAA